MAQDAGGLRADLTFSQGLTYSDSDGTQGRTDLGFGVSTATRTQSLNFDLGAALVQDIDDGFATEIVDPQATLSYSIESRQTAVSSDVSYQQSDTDAFVADPDGAPEILILDDGKREDTAASLGLTFGREMRFGGTIDLGYRETNYSDTTDVSLVDSQTTSAGVGLRFEVDQRITTTLGYDWSETDRETGNDTRNQRLSAGAQLAVTPTLDANLSVGLRRITTTTGTTQSVEDGVTFSARLTQTRPLGALSFSIDSDLSEAGRRTTAIAGTTFETRRGELMANVGLSDGPDNTLRPLIELSYSEDMPRGSYSVSVNQGFETTSDGDETLNSRLRLDWQQDLTRTSRMSSNVTYRITDVLNANEDTSRLELGISYSQDLTEDWAVTTRYTHSFVEQDGAANTRENEIFVGLETSFGWRP